jgi:hypothetical protein
MAQKKETLDVQLVEKLKSNQTMANESVLNLGQAELRLIELKLELDEIEQLKQNILENYRKAVEIINSELRQLETKYPSGEIDLTNGIVIYEEIE